MSCEWIVEGKASLTLSVACSRTVISSFAGTIVVAILIAFEHENIYF